MRPTKQSWGIGIAIVAVAVLTTYLSRQRGRPPTEACLGFDSGFEARQLAEVVAENAGNAPRGWMRVRGVPDQRGTFAARNQTRLALRELRRHGVRPFALVTSAGYPWPSGVRDLAGVKGTLPLDLRDAFARGEWLGERYGAEVEAWEIDNEPELIYVRDNPENYAAYLKAMYLGLKRGAQRRRTEDGGRRTVDGGTEGGGRKAVDATRSSLPATHYSTRAPRVVMAPMAFPPGPYFEALLDNDLLSYTDGFNFHYYGYEEDFPGVYRQFEAAVRERSEQLEERLQMDRHDASYASRDDNAGEHGARERAEDSGRRTGDGGRKTADRGQRPDDGNGRFSPENAESAELDRSPLPPVQSGQFPGPSSRPPAPVIRKALPIFISEYGYGILSQRTSTTTEGRVRQWEYFRALAGHMRDLRIGASMAFLLRPYLEDEAREFGLLMAPPATSSLEASGKPVAPKPGNLSQENAESAESDRSAPVQTSQGLAMSSQPLATSGKLLPPGNQPFTSSTFPAGGITFTPSDFGASGVEPWMRDIARRMGEWEASPALAWLLHQPPLPEPRDWKVVVRQPSPIVIDFVAETGMRPSKSSRGHFLGELKSAQATGRGRLMLYNFGRTMTQGVLRVEGHASEPLVLRLELTPGERREVALAFAIDREPFGAVRWTARFECDAGDIPPARFQSLVYPEAVGLRSVLRANLQQGGHVSAVNAANLDARRLAHGEAPLRPAGRWRVTKGLRVEESSGVWRFTVDGFPDEVLRPAVAELPLPDNFVFQTYDIFAADVRLVPRGASEVTPAVEPRSEPEFSAMDQETVGFYFRTERGGLYATSMHFPVSTAGMRFGQMAGNFTPVFYGRMHLPWRFLENKPLSLVIMFRPRLLPATYEIRQAKIAEIVK